MDIRDDPRIKELQEKLDKENDPQKLPELMDQLMKLIDEIESEGNLRSAPESSRARTTRWSSCMPVTPPPPLPS